MFFLSAELNIFEKYQQFKDYLSDYETLHCARYVAYHGTKDFKDNDMFDLTPAFHTGILLHYFSFLIPKGCKDSREETKTKKFQIIFALGICFTATALLFVSLERPLI